VLIAASAPMISAHSLTQPEALEACDWNLAEIDAAMLAVVTKVSRTVDRLNSDADN
jgi:hypothetical protein